jgi:polysaccharide pyruvyl transferase WcaK-like protein
MEHQRGYDTALLVDSIFQSEYVHVLPIQPFAAEDLLELFAGVDAVLSARMHPCIIAATQGTPWIAIERNDKLSQFSREMGNVGLQLEGLDSHVLGDVLTSILSPDQPRQVSVETAHKRKSALEGLQNLNRRLES